MNLDVQKTSCHYMPNGTAATLSSLAQLQIHVARAASSTSTYVLTDYSSWFTDREYLCTVVDISSMRCDVSTLRRTLILILPRVTKKRG